MKNLGYFIAGFFAMLWISQRFCSPAPASIETKTTDTVYDHTHEVHTIEFHHWHSQTTVQVPQLTPEEKDSVLQDHYAIRFYDTTFTSVDNYMERLRIQLQGNQLISILRDFENLRPTAINTTTIISKPARFRCYLGVQTNFNINLTAGRLILVPMAAVQGRSDQIFQVGYNPYTQDVGAGILWKIKFGK